MASFDISKITTDPGKHYSSVRMQQGKVLLDSDHNADSDIHENIDMLTNVDVIGSYGSPDNGFMILDVVDNAGKIDFKILPGTLYLGGLRLEMEAIKKDPVSGTDIPETFLLQRDWLQMDTNDPVFAKPEDLGATKERYDLAYLEAWRQGVCAVEDSSLLEMAVGVDTTTRYRNMRRVNLFTNTESPECPISWKKLVQWADDKLGDIKRHELIPDTKLTVSFTDSGSGDSLCSPVAAGGYLGAENQAIRVQIRKNGKFTWGFDNASPLYRVRVTTAGGVSTVKMLMEPKDQYHWPVSGQVVEILPWSAVLPNKEKIAEQSGFISKVHDSYSPDEPHKMEFTLDTVLPAALVNEWESRADHNELELDFKGNVNKYFYMRVWNRGSDPGLDAELDLDPGVAIPLGNTGLAITFSGNNYLPEDYWVIAARPETPQTLVPWVLEKGTMPHGVRRFLAPLAIIHWTIDNNNKVQGRVIHDCRRRFHPLTEQECCCTYTVGDGVTSRGDFQLIQDAVDHLPAHGGKICVLPGIHSCEVKIELRKKIRITGCGDQTILVVAPPVGETFTSAPLFYVAHSQDIRIDNLTMYTPDGIAVLVQDISDKEMPSRSITIDVNHILAYKHAIRVELLENMAGYNDIKILYNKIGMYDKEGGDVAIFTLADGILIERNRIVMIARPRDGGEQPPQPPPPHPPFEECDCEEQTVIYKEREVIRKTVDQSMVYTVSYKPSGAQNKYLAMGGIQVGLSSEQVWILQNEIIGGKGHGIVLGDSSPFAPIRDLNIEENMICQMGLSGISVLQLVEVSSNVFEHLSEQITKLIFLIDVSISRNLIHRCALQLPELGTAETANAFKMAYGGIVLSVCQNCTITGNCIENNGRAHLEPVCGIFILAGERIDISNNRINNNGPRIPSIPDEQATNGFRGGIVVMLALQPVSATGYKNPNEPDSRNYFFYDASNAIKVHDNAVRQPLGHALFIKAFGPVSVVSNQFTSTGIDKGNVFSLLAGTVVIWNAGISKDMYGSIRNSFASSGNFHNVDPTVYTDHVSYIQYQIFPSGKTLFTANQVMLDLRGITQSKTMSSVMIFTLDDLGFSNNQSECATLVAHTGSPDTDKVLYNTYLFGVSLRANDNRFTDGYTIVWFSLRAYGIVVSVTDNQASHCLSINGNPLYLKKDPNTVIFPAHCEPIKLELERYYTMHI